MLEIVETPNEIKFENKIKLFLAGGISNCPDWREDLIVKLKTERNSYRLLSISEMTIFNPRRKYEPDISLKNYIKN